VEFNWNESTLKLVGDFYAFATLHAQFEDVEILDVDEHVHW
jgi:hypothetical protein